MWSLPDIKRLNEEAVVNYEATKKKTEKQLCRGKVCEFCEKAKATVALEYYDIFADIPKGHIFMCEKCCDRYGSIPEGYFYCDDCQRLHIENYTWELYHTYDPETYELLCLNCAFDREIEKNENWITSVDEVTWERVRQSKHLIPVKGDHWEKHLLFVGNVEFDSMTGGKLTGGDSSSTPEDGLNDLREIVKKALAFNAFKNLLKATTDNFEIPKARCILILDGGYQFAVSIGVYIDRWNQEGGENETNSSSR